jgi:hypothetical protein
MLPPIRSDIRERVCPGQRAGRIDLGKHIGSPGAHVDSVTGSEVLVEWTMNRDEVAQAVVAARLARGLSWQELAGAITKPVVWVAAVPPWSGASRPVTAW